MRGDSRIISNSELVTFHCIDLCNFNRCYVNPLHYQTSRWFISTTEKHIVVQLQITMKTSAEEVID
jgi:hypothetical protein